MVSMLHHQQGQKKPVNWKNMFLLILIFVGVNNCYWITIYNVTYLGGNKFVNGVILGISPCGTGGEALPAVFQVEAIPPSEPQGLCG